MSMTSSRKRTARVTSSSSRARSSSAAAVNGLLIRRARFGVLVGGPHHPIPEGAGLDRAVDLAVKDEVPGVALFDRLDEGIADKNGQIEVAQPVRVGLGI